MMCSGGRRAAGRRQCTLQMEHVKRSQVQRGGITGRRGEVVVRNDEVGAAGVVGLAIDNQR